MVCPYLKNKGSAVRFCLWPPIKHWLFQRAERMPRLIVPIIAPHIYVKPYKHWNDIRDIRHF